MRNVTKGRTKKKPLYVFFHIFKGGGTNIREHIFKNLEADEVLFLYRAFPPYLAEKEKIKKYIKSLTKKQKDKIKIIFGYKTFYGLHKLFPNREVRYIAFLRNPVDRTISDYNFRRKNLKTKIGNERLRKMFIKNGKILNFKEWFLLNDVLLKNFMFKSLFKHFSNKKIKRKDIKVNEKNFKKIKKILDKFYFVGITEKPEDFLFLYNKLTIKRFLPNQNISKEYFVPKDYEKTKKFILSKNRYDQELYDYALKLNKKFKSKDFYKKVKDMQIKRERYFRTISYLLVRLKYDFLQSIYEISVELKKRSKSYAKFIDLVKKQKKKKPLYIFLHVKKCAGTTIRQHLIKNFKEDEVLLLYDYEPPYLAAKRDIKRYINSLTKKQKNKLKILFGHTAYYNLDRLFPNREVRYITFLRNPVDRTISHYNYKRKGLKNRTIPKKDIKGIIMKDMRNEELLNFRKWLLLNNLFLQNFIFKSLFICFFCERPIWETAKTNKENLKKIKRIFDKFYFVGITEKPEDFLFLYHELGIKKFFPDVNISKKYFIPKDYEKTKKFILSKNKFDKELYKYAFGLNQRFKRKYKDFYKKVKKMEIKRKKYILRYKVLELIYKLSARLKKRSKLYTKFINVVKGI